jgi:hypothetical protein
MMASCESCAKTPCITWGIATLAVALSTPVRADDLSFWDQFISTPDGSDKSGYDLFNPTPDDKMRKFAPDRPTKAFSVRTVDAGHVQFETDFVNYIYSDYGGVKSHTIQAFDPVWKLGVTNWADIEIQFNGFQTSSSSDDKSGASILHGRGFGDVILRTKVNLIGNDGGLAGFALIPYVKLPSAAPVISNGVVEGGLIAPLALRLPQDFLVTLMTEVDAFKDATGSSRNASFTNLVSVSHPLPGFTGVNITGEVASTTGTDKGTPPIDTFDAGLTYLVAPNIQFDVGLNLGLNNAAPKEQLYTGVSFRF